MISSNAVTIETFLEEFFQCRNIVVDMPEWLPTKKTFTKIPNVISTPETPPQKSAKSSLFVIF